MEFGAISIDLDDLPAKRKQAATAKGKRGAAAKRTAKKDEKSQQKIQSWTAKGNA
jgi:hypothetical protein